MRRMLCTTLLLLPVLAACSSFGASAQTLAPRQASLVDNTCAKVMGLSGGGYYYQQCQESLSNTLLAKAEAEQTGQAYDGCRRSGLTAGSPAFATCVLDRQNAAPAQDGNSASPVNLVYPAADLGNGKSYFNVPNAMHWKREQYACAQLGLVPASGAFTHCVASLDAALSPNPD